MENQTIEKSKIKKETPKRKSVLKKLDLETGKLLQSLKDKANKKTYGRKIKDGEILAKALTLVESAHLTELQESTLSEKDRLHIAHEEFMKTNGKLTLDQFIGKLLKGELAIKQ